MEEPPKNPTKNPQEEVSESILSKLTPEKVEELTKREDVMERIGELSLGKQALEMMKIAKEEEIKRKIEEAQRVAAGEATEKPPQPPTAESVPATPPAAPEKSAETAPAAPPTAEKEPTGPEAAAPSVAHPEPTSFEEVGIGGKEVKQKGNLPEAEFKEIKEEPKKPKEEGRERAKEEAVEKTADLNQSNRGFFGRMSEGGKKIAGKVYEALYKIPGVNKVVGKLEIAYNQFWLDRHGEKSLGLKNKMEGLDLKIQALKDSRKQIKSAVEALNEQGITGIESLQLKIRDLGRVEGDLSNKRAAIESKLKVRERKMELYEKKRNGIADRLIERYDRKLEPIKKELEKLQDYNNETDLLFAVTELRHKEQIGRLSDIEERKTQIEQILRETGMSEKEIGKFEAVKTLEGLLVQGRENIRKEKENLDRRKAETDERIAKVSAKADLYGDKRKEFERVKERKPLKIEAKAKRVAEEEERISKEEEKQRHREAFEKLMEKVEAREEGAERLTTADYISAWNRQLLKAYEKTAKVNLGDFSKRTGLVRQESLPPEDFKNILTKYYKVKKILTPELSKSISKFKIEASK